MYVSGEKPKKAAGKWIKKEKISLKRGGLRPTEKLNDLGWWWII